LLLRNDNAGSSFIPLLAKKGILPTTLKLEDVHKKHVPLLIQMGIKIVSDIIQTQKLIETFDHDVTNGCAKDWSIGPVVECTDPLPYIPTDVLLLIFSYLHFNSLVACTLVCKLWKQITNDERLVSNNKIFITQSTLVETTERR
jgi:hypothetical protein